MDGRTVLDRGPHHRVVQAVSQYTNDPGVYFSCSTDFGLSWHDGTGQPQSHKFEQRGTGESVILFVTVGRNHEVYVFYYKQNNHTIRGRRSTTEEASWTSIDPLPENGINSLHPGQFLNIERSSTDSSVIRNICQPQAAVNPVNGDIYLVYPDKPAADESDIFFLTSSDRGDTWSAPQRVNDDNTTHDQWSPSIAVNSDGTQLFIGFYDRRCSSTNTLIHAYGVSGDISGSSITFRSHFQIFSSPFEHETNGGNSPMTDYDTAIGDDEYFYYAWTDQRILYQENAGWPVWRDSDIRFVRIDNQ